MYRTLSALVLLVAGGGASHAGALDDARAARDLVVSSLERLDGIDATPADPLALAEQLRVEVHKPLVSLYIPNFNEDAGYDRSELLPFRDCFLVAAVEVARFGTEIEYALKIGKPLPEMTNRPAYTAALDGCNAALQAATKP